ncbi:hypothetical protein ACNARU_16310 [Proteus sp. WDL240414]|uniref:Uncharacterized protein n=1 Tax=Proteus columbae TaxID=1987580 RepID=A0A6I7D5V1_9GAMM|nr:MULTISPECIES: hypothetical protein [Proteus]ATN01090.1 hypothetical protein CRN77_15700 [Proteus vulgaris]MBI6340332.1 hypothetical protein [Proteus sp. PR00224]QHN10145.1 hypothetical protein F1325_06600 [Proteus columbae]QHN10313.1 hypothetical protein F1325_07495 [Proteus columbae]
MNLKHVGGILLIIGIVSIFLGLMSFVNTSNYKIAEQMPNITLLVFGGCFSSLIGAVFFGCGSIVDAIEGKSISLIEKSNILDTHSTQETNHEKIKEILKRR